MSAADIDARERLWDDFLQHWPLERLEQMTLAEYSTAGDGECFTYWMEARTDKLGSIWGGSAFKFGIYSRDPGSDRSSQSQRDHVRYSDDYGWYAKYGDTLETAFEQVRAQVLKVARAARVGQLEVVEQADLGHAFKWKLAFLYQDRSAPQVLPIYRLEYLQKAAGSRSRSGLELQRALMRKAGGQPVLAYYDEVLARIQAELHATLTTEQALAFLQESGQFNLVKEPTKKVAGFRAANGRELALALDNKRVTLHLEPGAWLNEVENLLREVTPYAPDKSRSSNLAANAPRLGPGNAILSVVVPDRAGLEALCLAYAESAPHTEARGATAMPEATVSKSKRPPLNQILFGPPGTGKTHATVNKALEVLAPEFLAVHGDDRKVLKARFDELAAAGHVRFVTFHQSFSYEDFVEGLRATTDEDGTLRYEVVDGVFKNLCEAAVAKVTQQAEAPIDLAGRRVWKMSLGNSQGSDAYIFDECIAKGYALLGYGELTDFSDCKDRDDVLKRLLDDGHTVTRDSYAVTAVSTFLLKMKVGDLLVVSEGNSKFRAIGEVTGDYEAITREAENDEYGQCRKVKWLRVYKPALPGDQLMNNQFSQMTLYELRSGAIDMEKLAGLLHSAQRAVPAALSTTFQVGELFGGYRVAEASGDVVEVTKPNGNRVPFGMSLLRALAEHVRAGRISVEDIKDRKALDKLPKTDLEPYLVNGYSGILAPLVERLLGAGPHSQASAEATVRDAKVLIIDEINRGNVSRVFGELITLIEPSKRAGHDEALELTLPYSKQRFSVPDNVYLIGTMNTADRSLAALDIALRRRFSFVEMPPRPDLLDEVQVQGVNIGQLLRAMNERIEVLLDRDHCLGHAYFMPLEDDPTQPRLAEIFRANILPLLQEYFFEDWQRIQWVLNDHRKPAGLRFLRAPENDVAQLFGPEVNVGGAGQRWTINEAAFEQIEAYAGIIAAQGA